MQTGIDWKAVKAEMEGEEWQEVEPGRQERYVYLGTVFNLTPSGKYYVPFACSNVEVCQACADAFDGPCDETSPCTGSTGSIDDPDAEGHCEVCRDAAYNKALEAEAEDAGYFVTSGEGDPCDILVGEYRDTPEEDEE